MITARYAEIIVNPDVTVVVKDFRSQVVYVFGDVTRPGGYEYRSGMTLMNALVMGGGPSKSGKRNEVLVIRCIAPDHIVGIQIDFKELIGKKRFDLDIPLEAFDIVYVPKSKLASVQDFTLTVRDIFSPPAELYLKGWQIANQKVLFDFYKRSGNIY